MTREKKESFDELPPNELRIDSDLKFENSDVSAEFLNFCNEETMKEVFEDLFPAAKGRL